MFYGPITVLDCVKMIWWGLTHPEDRIPAATPSTTLHELKRDLDINPATPVMVVPAADHSYRLAKPIATTAIYCKEPGRHPTLHEDHFPNDPPGKGFDEKPGTQLTRIDVLLVQ